MVSTLVLMRKLEIRTEHETTKSVFPHNMSITMLGNDIFWILPVTISELLAAVITLSKTIWQLK